MKDMQMHIANFVRVYVCMGLRWFALGLLTVAFSLLLLCVFFFIYVLDSNQVASATKKNNLLVKLRASKTEKQSQNTATTIEWKKK